MQNKGCYNPSLRIVTQAPLACAFCLFQLDICTPYMKEAKRKLYKIASGFANEMSKIA